MLRFLVGQEKQAATMQKLPFPQDDPQTAEAAWQRLHRDFALAMREVGRVRDGGAGSPCHSRVDERILQAVWCDQMLRPEAMQTASGKALEVIEPGRWNTGPGPDFLDARIRIAGELREGDVEIHTQSGDWQRHGHHKDFEYNRVILHVVLQPQDDRPYEQKQNGDRAERCVIAQALEPDLETIRRTVNLSEYPYGRPADLGLCHDQFTRLPEEQLTEFLMVAGRSRMEAKIKRFEAQRATASFLQVAYQALLTAQGYKSSKTLYFLLAKRAPLQELAEHARDCPESERVEFFLSALLHVAQLAPSQLQLPPAIDEETRLLSERLATLWNPLRPYFVDRLIPPTKRWFRGVRPAGFPTRRMAAVAELAARLTAPGGGLLTQIATMLQATELDRLNAKELRAFWKSLRGLIVVEGGGNYFSTHFAFGGKKQAPQALLGQPAAESLLFNVFLPLVILRAREQKHTGLEARAWLAIHSFPALEKNSIVKFMERRLFGEAMPVTGLLKRELFQQSLIKIFSDCCAQNERTCDDCTFLSLADRIAKTGTT
ncbi:DUF2851 family protein [Candidatus Sumerlaeota bacterium]|nr:DUF2851 family protein [Candidatus Sumerlaeota bacterium]